MECVIHNYEIWMTVILKSDLETLHQLYISHPIFHEILSKEFILKILMEEYRVQNVKSFPELYSYCSVFCEKYHPLLTCAKRAVCEGRNDFFEFGPKDLLERLSVNDHVEVLSKAILSHNQDYLDKMLDKVLNLVFEDRSDAIYNITVAKRCGRIARVAAIANNEKLVKYLHDQIISKIASHDKKSIYYTMSASGAIISGNDELLTLIYDQTVNNIVYIDYNYDLLLARNFGKMNIIETINRYRYR